MTFRTMLAAALLLPAVSAALAKEPAAPDFEREVWPILQQRCVDCHGADAQEARLRLDGRKAAFRGGVSGAAITAGQPDKSLLLARVLGQGDQARMPLDDDPLTDAQIAVLKRWIAAGAHWPASVGSEDDSVAEHWAFQPVRRPVPPLVKEASWPRSPLDQFILARLEAEELAPAAAASRAKLIRRVYLDLIGLPPSPAEVTAFEQDRRPDAYERVVDRLLADPGFGERWARPWLDLARYADSNGFQADQYRSVWPYRDWVVGAMNADLPLDRFAVAQLAGDLLPEATIEEKIASGFNRLTPCNVEAGVDPEENRTNQIVDRVNTTATAFLGVTLGCAQCHNHKYDPFSQVDYYRFFAYFNNTPLEVEGNGIQFNFVGPKLELPLTGRDAAERNRLLAEKARLAQQRKAIVAKWLDRQETWEARQRTESPRPLAFHVLTPEAFASAGGASYEVLEDGSVLVSGKRPDKDLYTVTFETELTAITGFKVEALTDESLPGKGPGRHHPERPNFVLNELSVTATSAGKPSLPVPLGEASASYSQAQYPVAGAIDGKPNTGWAIHAEFHKSHAATFWTKAPLGSGERLKLTFKLAQNHGECRTIGRLRISAITGDRPTGGTPPGIVEILNRPAKQRSAKQIEQLRRHYLGLCPDLASLDARIAKLDAEVAQIEPTTTLVMVEMDKPRKTRVLKRGDFLSPGEAVEPGTPRLLPPLAEYAPQNRLGLARWIGRRDNPLTARTFVNRWWAEIFGQGLVATTDDLGTQGEPPTHPELLDYLAFELMHNGWSRKAVLRQIVTSSTYRQAATVTPGLLDRDPENKLLARGPRFRLPAETIRDLALTSSGLLCREMGGEPIYPPQPAGLWRHVGRNAPKYKTETDEDRFRRGLYVVWRRSAPYPSFTNFDAPDRASCVAQRPRTNTPLQALTLLNDPAYVEMAFALAQRILTESPSATTAARVEYGFRLCVSRRPMERETQRLAELVAAERERLEANPVASKQLLTQAPAAMREKLAQADGAELGAWFFAANVLLNLDETISK